MHDLNYHHLLYFWAIAKEGGVVPASEKLRVSYTSMSTQVKLLEERLGEQLFEKKGRRLVLTEMGHIVFRYADEMFSLSQEMLQTVRGKGPTRTTKFTIGIVDVVTKLIVHRLISPLMSANKMVRFVFLEGSYDRLLANLSLHELDIVIADSTLPAGGAIRAYSHPIVASGLTVFGTKALAKKYKPTFPASLELAPLLLPLAHSPLRTALNPWFHAHNLGGNIVAEFEDSALMKVFGADGAGLFFGPSVIEREICSKYGVVVVGRAPKSVQEEFFLLSAARKVSNPLALQLLAQRATF